MRGPRFIIVSNPTSELTGRRSTTKAFDLANTKPADSAPVQRLVIPPSIVAGFPHLTSARGVRQYDSRMTGPEPSQPRARNPVRHTIQLHHHAPVLRYSFKATP